MTPSAIVKEQEAMGAYRNNSHIIKGEDMDDNLGFQPTDQNESGEDFFEPDFSDTHEEVTMPPGSEVQLRIIKVTSGQDKNGSPDRRLLLEIVDEPYAKLVNYYIGLPGQNDDARKRNQKNLRLQKFMDAFRLEGRFNWADLVGATAWAILSYTPAGEYPDRNEIDKWVRGA